MIPLVVNVREIRLVTNIIDESIRDALAKVNCLYSL